MCARKVLVVDQTNKKAKKTRQNWVGNSDVHRRGGKQVKVRW